MKTRISPLLLGTGLALLLCGCKSQQPIPDPKTTVAAANADAKAEPAAPPQPADPWAGRTDLIQAPPAGAPAPVNLPAVNRFTLKNRLPVMAIEDHSLPEVVFELVVKAGSLEEGPTPVGQFAAMMLNKGTKKHSAEQIAETIDFVGGQLSAWMDLDGTRVHCKVLSKDANTCRELVAELVRDPTFPEKEMGQVRDQLIASVKQVRDSDRALAEEHFQNLLWGDEHPRGIPPTVKSVQAVVRGDLEKWHGERFKPNNALLVVAGDLDRKSLPGQLEQAFAGWKAGAVPARPAFAEPKLTRMQIRLVDKSDQTQSQLRLGHLGLRHADPDFLATLLANYTLGGGAFSSRLMKVVRSEGGKTYGASSHFEAEATRGAFQARTFTRNAETLTTLKMVLDEIRKMRESGPSEKELDDAKSNLAGKYPTAFESAEDVATAILRAELHGLPEDYVRELPLRVAAVTPEQVRAAARAHLDDQVISIVIVGKAEEVEPQLKAAGLIYEKVAYMEPTSAKERQTAQQTALLPPDPAKTFAGQKLLEQALAAKGGTAKLKGIKDLNAKGTLKLSMQGQSFDGELLRVFSVPDRMRLEIKLPMMAVTSVITPQGGWQAAGPTVMDLSKDKLLSEQAGMWRAADLVLLRGAEPGTVVQAGAPQKRGEKSFDLVELRKADGQYSTKLLLDSQTHLLARIEYEKDGQPIVESYDDYREVAGLKIAFKEHHEGEGPVIDIALTEVKLNAGVPAGAFDKLVQPAPKSQ